MPDPIIDSINAAGKPWWKSKTIWGLITTTVGIVAPKYAPVAQALPTIVFQLAQVGGLLLGLYGRVKTDGKPINNPLPR